MANPLRAWKYQPWRSLLLSAALAVGGFRALEAGLKLIAERSALWEAFFYSLSEGTVGVVVVFLIHCTLGAVAVLLLETKFSPGPIYASTLWTLVLCMMISLIGLWLIEKIVTLPSLGLIAANEDLLVGVVVGIFVKGRSYWRY